jgi:hypothetical protein
MELFVQFLHHFGGHFRLKIEYLIQKDGIDKASDILLDLNGEQLIKSTSSEPVHEHMYELLVVLWKSESKMNINININIIFSWAFLNWGIIVDNVLRKETNNSPIAAVAPMGTSLHQWE